MSQRTVLHVSKFPFVDVLQFQTYLRNAENEGLFVTAIGEYYDQTVSTNRANWYDYDLPANLAGSDSALEVLAVPQAAQSDKEQYQQFLAPKLDASDLVDRAVVFLGNADTEVVLLRPKAAAGAIPAADDWSGAGKVLKGDGTWGWTAEIVANDIIVLNAATTAFGGDNDTGDNGETASGFPTKGHSYLMGCALPMDGWGSHSLTGSPLPKLPFGLDHNGNDVPTGAHVEVRDRATGKSIIVPVIDIGPGKSTMHQLDLSVAAAKSFKLDATANNFGKTLDYRVINGAKLAGLS